MRVWCVILLLFVCGARAADEDIIVPRGYEAEEGEAAPPELEAPGDSWFSLAPYGALAALGGAGWYFLKKYKQRPGLSSSVQDEIEITQTRMLGNRQFLVVVRSGRQKMLLGVGPGMIQHLCFLQNEGTGERDFEAVLEDEPIDLG